MVKCIVELRIKRDPKMLIPSVLSLLVDLVKYLLIPAYTSQFSSKGQHERLFISCFLLDFHVGFPGCSNRWFLVYYTET